jgi:hypothetical protein
MHDPLPEQKLRRMYCETGLTTAQIARYVDLSQRVVSRRISEYGLWGMRPANFVLEPQTGYPTLFRTGDGDDSRLRMHRLVAIADGADPHKVFSGDYDVHHINGCGLDNRPENLELVPKGEHGALDGHKSEKSYSHEEYLEALVQEPPEWAEKLR